MEEKANHFLDKRQVLLNLILAYLTESNTQNQLYLHSIDRRLKYLERIVNQQNDES